VDYSLDEFHQNPIELFNVDMDLILGETIISGYEGWYASTFEEKWADYGTVPVGWEPGLYELNIGNPWWVGFHIDIDESISESVFISVYDVCIPEPATFFFLGLGVLFLTKKRKV